MDNKNKPPKKRTKTSKKKNLTEDDEEDHSLDDYNKDNWEDELENSSFLLSPYELERKLEGEKEKSVQNSQNSILTSLKINNNNSSDNNNNSSNETSGPSTKTSSTSDNDKKPGITMSQKFSNKLKGFMYSKKSNNTSTDEKPKPQPLVNEVSNLSEKITTSSSNYNVNNNKLYEDTSDQDESDDDDGDINDLELDYDFEPTESSTLDSINKKKRKFIWD